MNWVLWNNCIPYFTQVLLVRGSFAVGLSQGDIHLKSWPGLRLLSKGPAQPCRLLAESYSSHNTHLSGSWSDSGLPLHKSPKQLGGEMHCVFSYPPLEVAHCNPTHGNLGYILGILSQRVVLHRGKLTGTWNWEGKINQTSSWKLAARPSLGSLVLSRAIAQVLATYNLAHHTDLVSVSGKKQNLVWPLATSFLVWKKSYLFLSVVAIRWHWVC